MLAHAIKYTHAMQEVKNLQEYLFDPNLDYFYDNHYLQI